MRGSRPIWVGVGNFVAFFFGIKLSSMTRDWKLCPILTPRTGLDAINGLGPIDGDVVLVLLVVTIGSYIFQIKL